MSKTIYLGAIVLSAALAAACGSKGDDKDGKGSGDQGQAKKGGGGGAVVAACDQRGVKGMGFQTCTDYTGPNWTAKEVEAQCAGDKTFIAGTCPKEGIAVSCKMYAGKASELIAHYYDKADDAKAACVRMEGLVL